MKAAVAAAATNFNLLCERIHGDTSRLQLEALDILGDTGRLQLEALDILGDTSRLQLEALDILAL